MVFQAVSARVRTPAKSNPGCSATRLASALATLTYDSPTLSSTVGSPVVSKVTKPPELTPLVLDDPFDMVPPSHVPMPIGARSNWMAKKI